MYCCRLLHQYWTLVFPRHPGLPVSPVPDYPEYLSSGYPDYRHPDRYSDCLSYRLHWYWHHWPYCRLPHCSLRLYHSQLYRFLYLSYRLYPFPSCRLYPFLSCRFLLYLYRWFRLSLSSLLDRNNGCHSCCCLNNTIRLTRRIGECNTFLLHYRSSLGQCKG